MGCRTTTTRLPSSRNSRLTRRVVWLLPQPVRTAQTETTGWVERSMVAPAPSSLKFAPQAKTADALCISSP